MIYPKEKLNNTFIYLLVLSPLFPVVIEILASAIHIRLESFAVELGLATAAAFALCDADAHAMRRANLRPPSVWWGLFSPAYIIIRLLTTRRYFIAAFYSVLAGLVLFIIYREVTRPERLLYEAEICKTATITAQVQLKKPFECVEVLGVERADAPGWKRAWVRNGLEKDFDLLQVEFSDESPMRLIFLDKEQ